MRNRSTFGERGTNKLGLVMLFLIIMIVILFGAKDMILSHLKTLYAPTQEQLKESLKEIIVSDPEFIIDAFKQAKTRELQQYREKAKQYLLDNKAIIENSDLSPSDGTGTSGITLLYFFDYNCGYCKKSNQMMNELLAKNPDIKVVYKEFPILGEASEHVAKTALAVYALDKNKYKGFHDALMSEHHLTKEKLDEILKSQNISAMEIENIMNNNKVGEEILKIRKLAENIGITGTPMLVLNGEIFSPSSVSEIEGKINQAKVKKDSKDEVKK